MSHEIEFRDFGVADLDRRQQTSIVSHEIEFHDFGVARTIVTPLNHTPLYSCAGLISSLTFTFPPPFFRIKNMGTSQLYEPGGRVILLTIYATIKGV